MTEIVNAAVQLKSKEGRPKPPLPMLFADNAESALLADRAGALVFDLNLGLADGIVVRVFALFGGLAQEQCTDHSSQSAQINLTQCGCLRDIRRRVIAENFANHLSLAAK